MHFKKLKAIKLDNVKKAISEKDTENSLIFYIKQSKYNQIVHKLVNYEIVLINSIFVLSFIFTNNLTWNQCVKKY